MAQESYQFKAEIQQLLHILVHSLYTEREIFLRELISNAADALNRVQFEMLTQRDVVDPDVELGIRLYVDQENKTITVADTGIGMTREEMVENLGTIAQSGAAAFIRRLQTARAAEEDKEGDARPPTLEMIGQFGVGFYSAFMVADRVRVVSRSWKPDAQAVEWVSDGSASYSIGPSDKSDRGTKVIVELKEDAAEFANRWRIEQIVRRHSDFIAFPITLAEVGGSGSGKDEASRAAPAALNRQKPLWREQPRHVESDAYDEFYKHLTMDFDAPSLTSHLVADVPVDIRSILYVPARRRASALDPRADYGLRLYAKGVLIQENNKDLLPSYLRFVEGVVESEDLPLNVARETVQRNPAARRIQRALLGKLIRDLVDLSQNDTPRYDGFWEEFGTFIKEGVATDLANKDDLLPLLRFHSSRTGDGERVSLAEYVERMDEEQPAIYYLLGEDLDTVMRSPHLDYFQTHDIEVLTLVDPIDSFLVAALPEYDDRPLRNVDDASLELPSARDTDAKTEKEEEEAEGVPDDQFGPLVARFMTTLGQRITQVRESRVLTDHPCRLVSPEGQPGAEMMRVYRLLNEDYEIPPKILEINRRHPLIRNLAQMVAERPRDAVIEVAIEQMYENQLLLEGLHPNPPAMIPRLQKLLEAATALKGAPSGPKPLDATNTDEAVS
jgi:molecular chaperone HtpG